MKPIYILSTALLIGLATPSFARLKLVALPARANTHIQMDHPSAVLISEQRDLQLQKGLNRIDFAWKGVSLDQDSIRLFFNDEKSGVKLINVSYPPNEQALVWELYSDKAQTQSAVVSYLLQQIDKQIDYTGQLTQDESHLTLTQQAIVRNFSGENYPLAELHFAPNTHLQSSTDSGETKRLLIGEYAQIPVSKLYLFDASVQPWEPDKSEQIQGIPLYYRWWNNEKYNLGQSYLPSGKLRVFQTQDATNRIFNGENTLDALPIGKEARIFVSQSQDLKITQRKMHSEKQNITKNRKGYPILWDEVVSYQVEIESFKKQDVQLEIREAQQGEWELVKSSHEAVRKNNQQLDFTLEIPAEKKVVLTYQIKQMNLR